MKYFITGGAGFIGSNLSQYLMDMDCVEVTVYDNFCNGKHDFLLPLINNRGFKIVDGDTLNSVQLMSAMKGHDCVIHLAANADIAASARETSLDLKQTVLATYNVLEAMRENAIKYLTFPSGSGVYGDIGELAPKEDFGPLYPVSMYGATKLSAEALISAYSSLFEIKARIFRFANVIGPNQTHGVAFDLIKRLMSNPSKLQVLGDGYQSKSYIHVQDIINALILVEQKSLPEPIITFNVGTGDYITVRRIVEIVIDEMGLSNVQVDFGKTPYGWKGDVPVVRLNDDKLRSLGWSPKYTSEEAMRLSIQQMLSAW